MDRVSMTVPFARYLLRTQMVEVREHEQGPGMTQGKGMT